MIHLTRFLNKKNTAHWAGLLPLVFCSLANAEPIAPDSAANSAVITIKDDWVRPTNSGQKVGAAYMTITSKTDCELTGVTSTVAETVEIHSMTMNDGIMKMRQMKTLALKANKPVELAPGGFHFMLFGLQKPMLVGDKIDFNVQLTCGTQVLQPVNIISTVKDGNH